MKAVAEAERQAREKASSAQAFTTVELESSSSSSSQASEAEGSGSDLDPDVDVRSPKRQRGARGVVQVVTPEVVVALDRTNVSDRKAAHIFSAMASSGHLCENVGELIISPSGIRRARIKCREALATELKDTFRPQVPLILHWDGKIMEDCSLPGQETVDRLPVLVSVQDVVKLLAVPKLHAGTAVVMATSILQTLDEWGLKDRISGLCFDTTVSNTGLKGRVCVLIERELERDLLNLACRHHVAEIVLEKVFGLHDTSKSPNIELFHHFKEYWPRVDQTSFRTAMVDEEMRSRVAEWREEVIMFATDQLHQHQPRDNYRELLELTIIFLGGQPPKGVRFRYPGAIHRARWMSRAIYTLKMVIFREQYPMDQRPGPSRRQTRSETSWNHSEEVAIFIVQVYAKYWFQAPSSVSAPRNDPYLLKVVDDFPSKEISIAATTVFSGHLWYLSETLVGFAFFEDQVTLEVKRKMVKNLKDKPGSKDAPKRIHSVNRPQNMDLSDLVTTFTKRFFNILHVNEDFLQKDPLEWAADQKYQRSLDLVKSVRVVNDLAERGVALMTELNDSLTKSEEQKQFLFQVVEAHRKKYSAPTKAAALNT
ncbi:uncharacterized protein LOC126997731 [Eriocheir sinensis]|uniref:uncharacterized protein LOC126997731 n=1 Tax=Eriocheir sinensis TaxID=95602 RepID=UPI0021C67F5D|nr:uncharacterized protein LOC126997731 [Eriocheir sinensis]